MTSKLPNPLENSRLNLFCGLMSFGIVEPLRPFPLSASMGYALPVSSYTSHGFFSASLIDSSSVIHYLNGNKLKQKPAQSTLISALTMPSDFISTQLQQTLVIWECLDLNPFSVLQSLGGKQPTFRDRHQKHWVFAFPAFWQLKQRYVT